MHASAPRAYPPARARAGVQRRSEGYPCCDPEPSSCCNDCFHLTRLAGGVHFDMVLSRHSDAGELDRQRLERCPPCIRSQRERGHRQRCRAFLATSRRGRLLRLEKQPNGYAALAVFDDPAQGGNGNGKIDPGDAVYSFPGDRTQPNPTLGVCHSSRTTCAGRPPISTPPGTAPLSSCAKRYMRPAPETCA